MKLSIIIIASLQELIAHGAVKSLSNTDIWERDDNKSEVYSYSLDQIDPIVQESKDIENFHKSCLSTPAAFPYKYFKHHFFYIIGDADLDFSYAVCFFRKTDKKN